MSLSFKVDFAKFCTKKKKKKQTQMTLDFNCTQTHTKFSFLVYFIRKQKRNGKLIFLRSYFNFNFLNSSANMTFRKYKIIF